MGDPNKLSFATMLRVEYVKRWQIVNVVREQSVAEHSFMVMIIAREIVRQWDAVLKARNLQSRDAPLIERVVMKCAFWHDMAETITGDIHTAAKKLFSLSPTLKAWEEKELEDRQAVGPFNDLSQTVVKIADLLDAYRYLRLYGRGVRARDIAVEIDLRLCEIADGLVSEWQTAVAVVREQIMKEVNDGR